MELLGRQRQLVGIRSGVLPTGRIVFLLLLTWSVFSQNLVQNGNFEAGSGSFEDWQISHDETQTSYSGPTIASPGYNDPYYAGFQFEPSANDILSQEISTTPGDVYDINFWAEDGAGHNFAAYCDFGSFSTNLLTVFSIGPEEWYSGWTNFNFEVTATDLVTDLSFAIQADTGSEFAVDDISVVQVPVLHAVAVRSDFYVTVTSPVCATVIQASTNLVNWVAVCTNTPPFTFTDSIPLSLCRFYRAAAIVQQSQ